LRGYSDKRSGPGTSAGYLLLTLLSLALMALSWHGWPFAAAVIITFQLIFLTRRHISLSLIAVLSGAALVAVLLADGNSLFWYAPPSLEIAELQAPTSIYTLLLFGPLSLALAIAGLSTILIGTRREGGAGSKQWFLFLWTALSWILYADAIRFSYLVMIPTAILAGLGLAQIERSPLIGEKERKFVAVVLLLLAVYGGALYATAREPELTPAWAEALEFLGTQEPGAVLTWWPYGSWVQGVTGFPTVTDSVAGQIPERIRWTAQIFLAPDYEWTLKQMRGRKISYVVISRSSLEGDVGGMERALGTETAKEENPFIKQLFTATREPGEMRQIFDNGDLIIFVLQ